MAASSSSHSVSSSFSFAFIVFSHVRAQRYDDLTVQRDCYSTYHKTPNRKKGWEEFTRDSIRQAMAGLATSPEFTDRIIEHADRIQLLPRESSEEIMGSESDST